MWELAVASRESRVRDRRSDFRGSGLVRYVWPGVFGWMLMVEGQWVHRHPTRAGTVHHVL